MINLNKDILTQYLYTDVLRFGDYDYVEVIIDKEFSLGILENVSLDGRILKFEIDNSLIQELQPKIYEVEFLVDEKVIKTEQITITDTKTIIPQLNNTVKIFEYNG